MRDADHSTAPYHSRPKARRCVEKEVVILSRFRIPRAAFLTDMSMRSPAVCFALLYTALVTRDVRCPSQSALSSRKITSDITWWQGILLRSRIPC